MSENNQNKPVPVMDTVSGSESDPECGKCPLLPARDPDDSELDELQLEYRARERRFWDLRPDNYPKGKILDLKVKGRHIQVKLGKRISSGMRATVILVRLVRAPKALRQSFPDGGMVLKIYDAMNSLDDRTFTRDVPLLERREDDPGAAWGLEPRIALAEYARIEGEAETFAEYKRFDLKYRESGIQLKNSEWPTGWETGRIPGTNCWRHTGNLEARHHIAMQDYWRDERISYNKLRCHQGGLIPKLYAKATIAVPPADGGDMGVAPAYFYNPAYLAEYINGPSLDEMLERGMWKDKWLKLPRLLGNWADLLLLNDPENVGFHGLSGHYDGDIRVVGDAAYPEGLRFVHVKPAAVTFKDPRATEEYFRSRRDSRGQLVHYFIGKLQQKRNLPELEEGDFGDYEK